VSGKRAFRATEIGQARIDTHARTGRSQQAIGFAQPLDRAGQCIIVQTVSHR
jgi:hypothetical protein